MSRIGKKIITIPENVDVKIVGNLISVSGIKGKLSYVKREEINLTIENKDIIVTINNKIQNSKFNSNALWGLTRSLIFNMIEGVTRGYEKKLELKGVGYKVALNGGGLKVDVGYSHSVLFPEIKEINFSIQKNIITVSGINKELVGQVSANIRKIRKPDPYKGKGIRYIDEIVKLKQGKKSAS